MRIRKHHCLALALAYLWSVSPAWADDIRPESRDRPFADEKCIEQCDTESDQCMQDAAGDPRKSQVCDDQYSDCLQACERA